MGFDGVFGLFVCLDGNTYFLIIEFLIFYVNVFCFCGGDILDLLYLYNVCQEEYGALKK